MTRSRPRWTAWGAGFLALAMTGAGAPAASAAPVPTALPEPGDAVVVANDFENGSWEPWVQNGDAALSVVEVDSDQALLVSGRVADYEGIKTPGGILEPGETYTFTMDVRLADAPEGAAQGVRFVVEPAYTWVGAATMTADAWTTVTGTYTVPADADTATQRVYIGTENILAGTDSVPYDYYVDDLSIVGPPAEPDVRTVTSLTFDDGTTGDWITSGNPTLAYVDADGGQALSITRAADYEGIQSPVGYLEEGVEYTFSMRARLPEGTEGSTEIRFVLKPPYTWIGNTAIDGTGWTTVSGTFTLPATVDPAESQIYIGTTGTADDPPYTVLIDDLVVTAVGTDAPGEPWEPTPGFVPGGAVSPTETPLAAARGTGDVAALTFDDGPNPGETERLLDVLAANDVTATFCVIGQNIQAEGGAEILQRIVADGHTLCNHTTSYADMGSWTHAAVEADLTENLRIIRDALGDPDYPVPYFRAPNGSWGVTGEVAAALGMQPLGLGNVIFDWDSPDNDVTVEGLTAKLRAAITPGAVVLAHDGGGDRDNVVTAVETVVPEMLAEGWTFTLPQGGIPVAGPVLSTDFETDLGGWQARGDADGPPTVTRTTEEAHGGTYAALVSDRTGQGDGIGHTLTGLVTPGRTYDVTAWVKMAAGEAQDDIWLSMQRTTDGADAFDTLGQFADIPSSEWREVTASFTAPMTGESFLYFETSYNTGGAGSFLVDDIVVAPRETPVVQDITPLKSTVPFPVGVAIDSRETTGAAAQVVTRHFNQVTGENHMKPEAWYDAQGNFRIHPEATAIMDFAQENDLAVYGHVLVWHSQTPAWFFQGEGGTPLTDSEADQEVLRERMRTHIFDVAQTLSDQYGLFGSETNPLTAWDVVNEVVSDSGEHADGLRRSEWYRILGEDFIDLAFRYADEAFNGTYAVEGTDPVTLFINDYNTEQDGKQNRYYDLVARLLERDVPIDGVGHQFHVNLAMPVSALEAAIVRFADLPVTQVVTELDVTTGTPETEALFIEQGYYYRDAFRVFREHAEELFAVTVWGLNDARSWRASSGGPLLFDDNLQAKPAFYGAIDSDELPAPVQTVNVFMADIPLAEALASPVWARLPLQVIENGAVVGQFGLRWSADHLTAYVAVTDDDDNATDAVEFTVGDATYTFSRDGEGDVEGVVTETATGWTAAVQLPLTAAAVGDTVQFDVRVVDGDTTTGWNAPGALGTLTLAEQLSYTEAIRATEAPVIDGEIDAAWADANAVVTEKVRNDLAADAAEATVRTMWQGTTLYVVAEIADPVLDATGSDPWTQDSFEIFIDPGNLKNGPYLYETSQIRISFENQVSFGTGDENFQAGRVQSATQVVDGGYVVEAAVELGDEAAGLGTFHGLDFQVNDASNGERTGIKGWADPTGLGYQTTALWGVVQLVEAPDPGPEPEPEPDPQVTVDSSRVRAGDELTVQVSGYRAGSTVELSLRRERGRIITLVHLGEVTVGADGAATATVEVPARTSAGPYTVVATSGDLEAVAAEDVRVTPARSMSPWARLFRLFQLLLNLRG